MKITDKAMSVNGAVSLRSASTERTRVHQNGPNSIRIVKQLNDGAITSTSKPSQSIFFSTLGDQSLKEPEIVWDPAISEEQKGKLLAHVLSID